MDYEVQVIFLSPPVLLRTATSFLFPDDSANAGRLI